MATAHSSKLKLALQTMFDQGKGDAIEELVNEFNSDLSGHVNYELELKITNTVQAIDEQVVQLDNRMDLVLEQHEKDFLAAYRKHMIAVQKELT